MITTVVLLIIRTTALPIGIPVKLTVLGTCTVMMTARVIGMFVMVPTFQWDPEEEDLEKHVRILGSIENYK